MDLASYHVRYNTSDIAMWILLLLVVVFSFANDGVLRRICRQAAKLNQGLGASATQQAVVQSFLKNFDQVTFIVLEQGKVVGVVMYSLC